jgi:hypothetical protein
MLHVSNWRVPSESEEAKYLRVEWRGDLPGRGGGRMEEGRPQMEAKAMEAPPPQEIGLVPTPQTIVNMGPGGGGWGTEAGLTKFKLQLRPRLLCTVWHNSVDTLYSTRGVYDSSIMYEKGKPHVY